MEECEMQSTESIIHVMQTLGKKREPLTRIYRQLWNENLYVSAYSRLYANDGALTPGATPETADGMSLAKIRRITERVKTETYRWTPVRQKKIPRPDGRTRTLGIPTWSDKLVEEVMRIILEAYYEPIFSTHSHGYRPNRGCHTALQEIVSHWTGTVWLIEGDIKGCFDNIDHDILMAALGKRIKDNRLLRFIEYRLKSGVISNWQYHRTYSGTPQGGVLSPLLANIYLHELDEYIETQLMPVWNRGKERKRNPKYRAIEHQKAKAKQKGDVERYQELAQEMLRTPSRDMYDPNFRRLKYVRYADDFLIGFVGTKAEAKSVLSKIETFLKTELKMDVSPQKSRVTHAKTSQAEFLGYGVGVYGDVRNRIVNGKRTANGRVALRLPAGYAERKAREWQKDGKPRIDGKALTYSVEEALFYYQKQFRGIVNYYQYAVDVHELARVKYAMELSLVHTLASKLKITVSQIYRRLSRYQVVDGYRYKVLQVSAVIDKETGRTQQFTWGGIPLRRKRFVREVLEDNIEWGHMGSGELVARLKANACELCGKETRDLEAHHIHRMKDLQTKYKGEHVPRWVRIMTERRRKILFVCRTCHVQIHN
jgi:group II intron reverse transcriptase/maturase